jgi:hypothetical protein
VRTRPELGQRMVARALAAIAVLIVLVVAIVIVLSR